MSLEERAIDCEYNDVGARCEGFWGKEDQIWYGYDYKVIVCMEFI